MTPWIRIGGPQGVPASALGPVGDDIEVTHEWPDGGTSLSFTLLLPTSDRPAQISKKAAVDLMIGARPVWPGYLSEVDWDSGRITARGSATEGDSTPTLDNSGLTTSIPDSAVDSAITRGEVTWRRASSISSTAYGASGETVSLNSLTDLLTAWQTEAKKRTYVDPSRALRVADDPTVPSYHLLPGSGELSWASEAQADRLIGRYQSSAAGALSNVTVTAPGAKVPYTVRMIDMTPRGLLDSTRATNILQGILADVAAGGWTGGITITRHDFAGAPDLSEVAESVGRGLMVHKLGQRDPRPGRVPVGYIDFIVGQSVWRPVEDTITLTPIGSVARDWSAVLEENEVQEAA
jgi:hypothetical protein